MIGNLVGPQVGILSGQLVGTPRAAGGDPSLQDQVITALFGASENGVLYDPSDLTTLYQDSAGTTPVTADGDPVGRMEDLSGNGNHATQATAGQRPLYKTDGTLHWLQFDGVDDYLAFTSAASSTATLSMALNLRSGTGFLMAMSFTNHRVYANLLTAATWGGYYNAEVPSSYNLVGNKSVVVVRTRDFNDVDLFTNGNAVETVTTGVGLVTTSGYIGGIATTFAGAIDVYGMVGNLTVLSDTNVSLVKEYLADKSGVTL